MVCKSDYHILQTDYYYADKQRGGSKNKKYYLSPENVSKIRENS